MQLQTNKYQLVIAIDEASLGNKLFYSKFKNNNGHDRGLLTPIIYCLPENISIVMAGTSFSLRHGDSVISDVGKLISVDYLSDFQTLTIEDVEAYIRSYLNLSDCKIENIENWKYLAGRPQLAARLIYETVQEERHNVTESKQAVLEKAVNKTVMSISEHLKSGLHKLAEECLTKNDPQNFC